ncbi:MAG: GAF domain-containing protein [Pirellula sp.]
MSVSISSSSDSSANGRKEAVQLQQIRERVTFIDRNELWDAIKKGASQLIPCNQVELMIVSQTRDAVEIMSTDCKRFNDRGDLAIIQAHLPDPLPNETPENTPSLCTLPDGSILLAIRHAKKDRRLIGALRLFVKPDVVISGSLKEQLLSYGAGVGEGLYRRRLKQSDIQQSLQSSNSREILRSLLIECVSLLDCDCAEASFLDPNRTNCLQQVAVTHDDLGLPFIAPANVGIARRTLGDQAGGAKVVVVQNLNVDQDHESLLQWLDGLEWSSHFSEEVRDEYRKFIGLAKACVQLPVLFDSSECEGVVSFYWRNTVPKTVNLGMVFVIEQILRREAAPRAWLYRRRELANADVTEEMQVDVEGKSFTEVRDAYLKELAKYAMEKVCQHASKLQLEPPYRAAVCVVESLPHKLVGIDKRLDKSHACLRIKAISPENSWHGFDEWKDSSKALVPIKGEGDRASKSIVGQVALDRKPAWVTHRTSSSPEGSPRFFKIDSESVADSQALLAVPVMYGEQLYAVLDLEWRKECDAAAHLGIRSYVERLCDSCARTIAQQPIERELLLDKLSLVLAAPKIDSADSPSENEQNLRDVCDKFLKSVASFIDCSRGSVFLREAGSGRYTLRASMRPYDELPLAYEACPTGMGATGYVLFTKTPLRVERIHAPPPALDVLWINRVNDGLPNEHHSAFLAVPIISNDEVLGVVRFVHPLESFFSSGDLRLVIAASQQIAGYLQARDEIKRAHARSIVLEQAVASPTLEDFADSLFRAIAVGFGPCQAQLRVLDKHERAGSLLGSGRETQTEDVLRRVYSTSSLKELGSPLYIGIGAGISGKVWQRFKERDKQSFEAEEYIVEVNKNASDELARFSLEFPKTFDGVKSLLCLPIFECNRLEGTLLIISSHANAFSTSDRRFLFELSKLLCKAMQAVTQRENDRLDKELRKCLTEQLNIFLQYHPRQSRPEHLRDLLISLFNVLMKELLTSDGKSNQQSKGWVRMKNKSGMLTCISCSDIDAIGCIPDHTKDRVEELSGGKAFAVSFPKSSDNYVDSLESTNFTPDFHAESEVINKHSDSALEGYKEPLLTFMKNRQLCFFVLRDRENSPFASFSLVVDPSRAISYRRIHATAALLTEFRQIYEIASWFEAYAAIEPLAFATAQAAALDHDWNNHATDLVSKVSNVHTLDELKGLVKDVQAWGCNVNDMRMKQLNYAAFRAKLEPFPVAEVLSDLVEDLRNKLQVQPTNSRVQIAVKFVGQGDGIDGLKMEGERDLFSRAVTRLLENAKKNLTSHPPVSVDGDSAATGVIEVRMFQEKNKLVIQIRDNGSGMPTKIKDGFVESLAEKPRGGLAAAYCITLVHGGNLSIESEVAESRRRPYRLGWTIVSLTFPTFSTEQSQ